MIPSDNDREVWAFRVIGYAEHVLNTFVQWTTLSPCPQTSLSACWCRSTPMGSTRYACDDYMMRDPLGGGCDSDGHPNLQLRSMPLVVAACLSVKEAAGLGRSLARQHYYHLILAAAALKTRLTASLRSALCYAAAGWWLGILEVGGWSGDASRLRSHGCCESTCRSDVDFLATLESLRRGCIHQWLRSAPIATV